MTAESPIRAIMLTRLFNMENRIAAPETAPRNDGKLQNSFCDTRKFDITRQIPVYAAV